MINNLWHITVRIDRKPKKLNNKATLFVITDLLLLSDMRKPRNFSASAICTTAYSPPASCCGQSPSGGLKSLDLSLGLPIFLVPVYGCFEY